MAIDFLKTSRTNANIKAIGDWLKNYIDNKIISEEELSKILDLVRNEERLTQLIPYL